jgi:hypothetical protein
VPWRFFFAAVRMIICTFEMAFSLTTRQQERSGCLRREHRNTTLTLLKFRFHHAIEILVTMQADGSAGFILKTTATYFASISPEVVNTFSQILLPLYSYPRYFSWRSLVISRLIRFDDRENIMLMTV